MKICVLMGDQRTPTQCSQLTEKSRKQYVSLSKDIHRCRLSHDQITPAPNDSHVRNIVDDSNQL